MAKKPSFGPNFGLFWPKFSHSKIFLWILVLLDVRNCCKLSLYAIPGNTNEPNLRKWQKNPSFRPDFSPNMGPKKFFVGFISTTYHTLLQAIIVCYFKENQWTKFEKMAKDLVSGPILTQIWSPKIFFRWFYLY